MSRSRGAALVGAVLSLLCAFVAAVASPAAAIPPDGVQCLKSMAGSVSVNPSTITAGQFVTVSWQVWTPSPQSCPGLFSQQLDGQFVAKSGSMVLQPAVTHTFRLKGYHGVLNRELATATVTVPEPQAQLPGLYRGTITSDGGTTSGLTVEVAGPPPALTATITLDPGARADCNGTHNLGATTVGMNGRRTGVGLDGSSTYDLGGRFEFDVDDIIEVHVVVDVTVGGALLSADGQTFSGSAGLFIQPEHGSDCVKSWPFTVTRVPGIPVPSVVHLTVAQARSTLTVAGLRASVTAEIDRMCTTLPGLIMRQNPDADTLVQPDSVVQIVRAIKPSVCP